MMPIPTDCRSRKARGGNARARAAFVAIAVAALTIVGLAACGRAPQPTPVPVPSPTADAVVVLSASVPVEITSAPGAKLTDLQAVVPIPADIQVEVGGKVVLNAAARDGRGFPVSDIEYRWELLEPLAGDINVPRDPSFPTTFTASQTPGFFPGALSVSAIQRDGETVREVSQTVDVAIRAPTPQPTLASVEAMSGVIEAASGQLVRLQGVGYDALGRVLPGTRFEWELQTPEVGSLNALGYLDVEAPPGEYRDALLVRGTYGEATVESPVTVNVIAPQELTGGLAAYVLPRSVNVTAGSAFQFNAVTIDAAGKPVRNVEEEWRVLDPAAGTIDESGVFRAGDAPGVFPGAVEYKGVRQDSEDAPPLLAHATVNIHPPRAIRRLDAVQITPRRAILVPGESVLFRAFPVDSDGNAAENVETEWEVVDPTAGAVDEIGQFAATGEPGTYPAAVRVRTRQVVDGQMITRDATADIVIAGEIVTLEVSPASVSANAGQVLQLRARAFDRNHVAVPGVLYEWSVSDPAVGDIGLAGDFQAGDTPGYYPDAIRVTAKQQLSP